MSKKEMLKRKRFPTWIKVNLWTTMMRKRIWMVMMELELFAFKSKAYNMYN